MRGMISGATHQRSKKSRMADKRPYPLHIRTQGAWENADLKPMEKLVYLCLAEHANADTGICWPSVKRLADMTGLNDRTVRRVLSSLTNKGAITKQLTPGHTTHYTLVLSTLGQTSVDLSATPPSPSVSPTQGRDDKGGRVETTPEPLKNSSVNKKKNPPDSSVSHSSQ